MSLGVRLKWRARDGFRGLPLIPRARIASIPLLINQHVRSQCYASLTATAVVGRNSRLPHLESQDSVQQSQPIIASSPTGLIDRLEKLPVRQHGDRESVLVEPRIQYDNRLETRRSERKNHQGLVAQQLIDGDGDGTPPANWRQVLHYLATWTPKHSECTVEVAIPTEAADRLLSDEADSLWDIQSRTGVALQFSGDRKPGEHSRTLVFTGSRSALDTAIADLLRITKKATGVRLPLEGLTTGHDASALRKVDNQDQSSTIPVPIPKGGPGPVRPYTLTVRACDIPRPATWTAQSFEQYVSALTTSRVPSTLVSRIYPKGTSHDEAVIQQLHEVFNDPAARAALSRSAFKTALAFMAKKGPAFRPHARALFVRMDMFGMRMDTDAFNILAELEVKSRNLRGFANIVKLMVKRGHAPNLNTWLLFLRLIKSEEVRRYILHAMDRTGLLDGSKGIRRVAMELAAHDIDRAIQQGKDLDTFLANQERLYGPNWLSRKAGNRVLEFLGRSGRFDDCATFINIMAATRSARPDVVTLNTVLTHYKLRGHLNKAVDMLERFDQATDALAAVVPDVITYHLLFEMSWRHKSPHVAGLIWRYSWLVNKTPYRMRARLKPFIHSAIRASGLTSARVARLSDAADTHDSVSENEVTTSTMWQPVELSAASEELQQPPGPSIELLMLQYRVKKGIDVTRRVSCGNNTGGDATPELGVIRVGDAVKFVMQWYAQVHRDWEPASPLSRLLREAMVRDNQLHRDLKEGKAPIIRPVWVPTRRRVEGLVGPQAATAE
ncbi:hypothetical protein VTK73DRAFT_2859 [Phialemonium thermophilum]|uniref:Pentatricopeptide repeat domain-containing protein n=1 Tax=Phialemonium thermophilum TaxID=223376 RepID=A0ABR3X2Y6_9PEZI